VVTAQYSTCGISTTRPRKLFHDWGRTVTNTSVQIANPTLRGSTRALNPVITPPDTMFSTRV
jgi:hypothetical protein